MTLTVQTLLIEARTHGRVLLREAETPRGLLLGYHGYGETAETHMSRLDAIPGALEWTLVSVQGLHRFYRGRTEQIAASWMTRQDREAAIEDNIDYVNRVVAATRSAELPIVYAGFSQGAAMAFRAAARGNYSAAGVIAVAGDVPPELLKDASVSFPRVLLARGEKDEWYTEEKLQSDVIALTARAARLETLVHSEGHDWTTEVSAAAGAFLAHCV